MQNVSLNGKTISNFRLSLTKNLVVKLMKKFIEFIISTILLAIQPKVSNKNQVKGIFIEWLIILYPNQRLKTIQPLYSMRFKNYPMLYELCHIIDYVYVYDIFGKV